MRRFATVLIVALFAATAPAQAANVHVEADGTDGGANPHDTFTLTGTSTRDNIVLRDGFSGDSGDCVSVSRLCFITISSNNPITVDGACALDNDEFHAHCGYFSPGS